MKITKFIIPLVLGLAGGLIAYFIADNFGSKTIQPTLQHQIVGPGAVRPVVHKSENDVLNDSAGPVDLRMAAKKTVPAVVNVMTVQMRKEYYGNPLEFWFGGVQPQMREVPRNMGIGSGVIITEDGYIITNNHVIDRSDKVMVTLNDKREFEAKVIGTDPDTDIALLKIDANGLQPIEYGNSDDVVLGEWVLAVGNPYNLTSTVTAGIISAKARQLGGKMNLESFLQTDAAVNPGNSGGALVNAKGELIGINTAIQSPTGSYSGYSFAVPVNVARKVVSDLKEYGKVQRAMIGIKMQELTPALAKEYKLKEQSGIYVAEVIPGGAAEKAGVKVGDVILQLNGYEAKTFAQLQEQLAQYTPGNTVQMTLSRDGIEKVADVVLHTVALHHLLHVLHHLLLHGLHVFHIFVHVDGAFLFLLLFVEFILHDRFHRFIEYRSSLIPRLGGTLLQSFYNHLVDILLQIVIVIHLVEFIKHHDTSGHIITRFHITGNLFVTVLEIFLNVL